MQWNQMVMMQDRSKPETHSSNRVSGSSVDCGNPLDTAPGKECLRVPEQGFCCHKSATSRLGPFAAILRANIPLYNGHRRGGIYGTCVLPLDSR